MSVAKRPQRQNHIVKGQEMKTTTKTQINAPASTVFLWLDDNDRLKQWVPNLTVDEVIVDTPEKIGTRFRQVFQENGRKMEMMGEITAYVENKHMRVYMSGKMFNLDVEYILTAVSEAQTDVTQNTQIQFKGFLKILAPLMFLMSKISSKDPQADAHAKLKAMAEAEYQAG